MTENEKEWIKFERKTNADLEEMGSQYRLVFLPEKDLMPYQDARECTELENRIEEAREKYRERRRQLIRKRINPDSEKPEPVLLQEEDWDTVRTALMVYKAALLAVHGRVMRSPAKTVIWEDDFGEGGTGYAKCPNCHELAYDIDTAREKGQGRCPFCGQAYTLREEDREKAEPNPEETLTCPQCHQETLVGRRAKSNGHFHGRCTNCGCRVMV